MRHLNKGLEALDFRFGIKDRQVPSHISHLKSRVFLKNRLITGLSWFLAAWLLLSGACFAAVYEFGEDKTYVHLRDFDWDLLKPGDLVNIYKKAEPYREILVLNASGTREHPIVIRGVPDNSGRRPVIDGTGVEHFQKMCREGHAGRGLIIVGDCTSSDYIRIENLELRNANNKRSFHLDGTDHFYSKNAAGLFLWKGKDLKVKNCIIRNCGMGILTNRFPDTDRFYLGYSRIFNNGDFTRKSWGHNVYIQARKTLIEFNRFGELFSDGHNIKDRSRLSVIRYNWVAGGMSHQLDLVENLKYGRQDAFVYGNFITQGSNVVNPIMVLFGGDLTDENKKPKGSRSGKLYFFNNTMISGVKTDQAFLSVNRPDCSAILTNNVLLGRDNIWAGLGRVTGTRNFVSAGARTRNLIHSIEGGFEQFFMRGKTPYYPVKGSLLVNMGKMRLPAPVRFMPSPVPRAMPRPRHGAIDIGAFEN